MLKLKRVLGYGGLTGLLAAAAFAIPASASVKGDCVVDGVAKTQDKDQADLGVRISGGQGKFTFGSITLDCVADTNKDGIPEVIVGLEATATGWFDNTVCGTGKAFGTVETLVGGPPKLQVIVGKKFAVQFVATEGVFKWHDWDKPDSPVDDKVSNEDDNKDTPEGGWTPAGSITLSGVTGDGKPTPTPEQELANIQRGNCVKAFRATGTVLVDFAA